MLKATPNMPIKIFRFSKPSPFSSITDWHNGQPTNKLPSNTKKLTGQKQNEIRGFFHLPLKRVKQHGRLGPGEWQISARCQRLPRQICLV